MAKGGAEGNLQNMQYDLLMMNIVYDMEPQWNTYRNRPIVIHSVTNQL